MVPVLLAFSWLVCSVTPPIYYKPHVSDPRCWCWKPGPQKCRASTPVELHPSPCSHEHTLITPLGPQRTLSVITWTSNMTTSIAVNV